MVHLAWPGEGLEKEGLNVIGIACKGPSSPRTDGHIRRYTWRMERNQSQMPGHGFGRWQYQHGRASIITLSPVPGAFHRGCHRGSSP